VSVFDLELVSRRSPRDHRTSTSVDLPALVADLQATVEGEVRFTDGDRALYATDASNYRHLPVGVVVPRTVDDVVAAVAACRRHGAPVVCRGGGTSLAGQCCNVAVVIDFSKYLNRVLEVDPERRLARVQPGVVLDDLRDAAEEHGLTFGPDPATHNHNTLGGMIGNNSCGVHALMAGKTVDNVEWLDVLLYDGTRMRVGQDGDDLEAIIGAGGRKGEVYAALRDLRDRHLAQLRTRYPDIPRRVSGYNLDSLLPENGFHVAQALVGSEGTLVTVLEAGLRLVESPSRRALLVLGYPDVAHAADAVPTVLESRPIGLEGLDHLLFELAQHKHLHPQALKKMPRGRAWLLAEFGGDDQDEANAKARDLAERLRRSKEHAPVDSTLVDDPEEERQVWQVREAGLGATARGEDGAAAWPGWEDSAVHPRDLGGYIRDLQSLYDKYGYQASLYGHFGQACLHTRIPFELTTAHGIAQFRSFVTEAAHLVADKYGGSLSGEHGDGQARGELLPIMFGDDVVRAFEQFKAVWDPDGKMNPGQVVDPYPVDADLRLGTDYAPEPVDVAFGYRADSGEFSKAMLRCVGIGKCREHTTDGTVMCPSYIVTREEKHSTRGRARLLWEMLNGHLREQGWRSEAVHDALDLCLACKGCKSDCPVNVDMATYKAEFLFHHFRHRLRPRAHYAMGWLPVSARLAALAPRTVNALAQAPGLTRLVKWFGGVAQERDVPVFASERFTDWFGSRDTPPADGRPTVVLWPDTFTNSFDPAIGQAAVEVLEAAGAHVKLPPGLQCCGLTWISTGQLDVAKRVLQRTLDALRDDLRAGVPVVALEPSCTAVFRSDAADLFPGDEDVARLQAQTFTLGEYLQRFHPTWHPPNVEGRAIAQVHCHQHAVMTYDGERSVLDAAGVEADLLPSGCCGLAGNFGFEDGHYDVSIACAERVLLPRVRAADPATAVIADGFSCRTQIEQGRTGRRAVHLAELLALGLRGGHGDGPVEQHVERPSPPSALVRWATTSVVAAAAAAAVAGAAAGLRQDKRR
jgi:FAD/FMN-containing dehydrogenase/Fe-S oxidoreductase